MDNWDGKERRKTYMELEERLRQTELQLAKLNGSLPALQSGLKEAVDKITEHENNASKRWTEHLNCMVQREKATSDLVMLKWLIAVVVLSNFGIIIKILMK